MDALSQAWKGRQVVTCTRDTMRCANARNYSHRLADCCRSHVIQIVRDMQPLLDDAGVTWWADYGTLLGAVRNPLTAAESGPGRLPPRMAGVM